MAAFSGFPLAIGKDARIYMAMDKGLCFLKWGYHTGHFQEAPLDDAMFHMVTSRAPKHTSELWDALSYFGVESAAELKMLQEALAQVMPFRVTDQGTCGSLVQHGAHVTWPCVFSHVCEAKQVVDTWGRVAPLDLLLSSMAYASAAGVSEVLAAGGAQECLTVHLLRQHAQPRRLKSKCRVSLQLLTLNKRTLKEADASVTPPPTKRGKSTLAEASPISPEANTSAVTLEAIGHSVEQASTRATTGVHAVRLPGDLCKWPTDVPCTEKFYSSRSSDKAIGCPNPASIMEPTYKRHFCISCRCHVGGPVRKSHRNGPDITF